MAKTKKFAWLYKRQFCKSCMFYLFFCVLIAVSLLIATNRTYEKVDLATNGKVYSGEVSDIGPYGCEDDFVGCLLIDSVYTVNINAINERFTTIARENVYKIHDQVPVVWSQSRKIGEINTKTSLIFSIFEPIIFILPILVIFYLLVRVGFRSKRKHKT